MQQLPLSIIIVAWQEGSSTEGKLVKLDAKLQNKAFRVARTAVLEPAIFSVRSKTFYPAKLRTCRLAYDLYSGLHCY